MTRVRSLIRHLSGRESLEREMDAEFKSHIALRADDLERRGLSREAAERAARVEFGGVEAQKEAAREARGLRVWDELRANVGFAIRGIGHHPTQSLIVVVTLTLGLGISGVVFSVMNALAFRARVDHDPATFTRVLASYKTDTTAPTFPVRFRSPSTWRTRARCERCRRSRGGSTCSFHWRRARVRRRARS